MNIKKPLLNSIYFVIYALLMAVFFTTPSFAGDEGKSRKHKKVLSIQGVVATGANTFLGEPFWDFGSPWGMLTFSSMGGYNAEGDEPFTLTPDTPHNMILASQVDPKLLALFVTKVPQNIPLRQNYSMINGSGDRGQLPPVTAVAGSEQSKSLPNDPITLGKWMNAKAKAKFICKKDGTAKVKMRFTGLVENGLYSVWATYGDPATGGLAPVPLGGTPNIIVPGSKGKAKFERVLNDCPLTPKAGEKPLLLIEVAYHSDGMVYGGVADLPDTGFPFGLTTHTHINFPVIIDSPLPK
jgi:hypothetical protein